MSAGGDVRDRAWLERALRDAQRRNDRARELELVAASYEAEGGQGFEVHFIEDDGLLRGFPLTLHTMRSLAMEPGAYVMLRAPFRARLAWDSGLLRATTRRAFDVIEAGFDAEHLPWMEELRGYGPEAPQAHDLINAVSLPEPSVGGSAARALAFYFYEPPWQLALMSMVAQLNMIPDVAVDADALPRHFLETLLGLHGLPSLPESARPTTWRYADDDMGLRARAFDLIEAPSAEALAPRDWSTALTCELAGEGELRSTLEGLERSVWRTEARMPESTAVWLMDHGLGGLSGARVGLITAYGSSRQTSLWLWLEETGWRFVRSQAEG